MTNSAKEACAVTVGITRVSVLVDHRGKCYPKATGEVPMKLQKLMDQYQGASVKPLWLLTQLTKTLKK